MKQRQRIDTNEAAAQGPNRHLGRARSARRSLRQVQIFLQALPRILSKGSQAAQTSAIKAVDLLSGSGGAFSICSWGGRIGAGV